MGAAAPKATVLTDPAGDAKGLDITRVSVGVASDGRLRASITLAKAWAAADLIAKDGEAPGSICLRLWTKTKPGATRPDYLACVWTPGGTHLKGTVMQEKAGTDPVPVGSARVTRSSTRTVTLTFAPTKIGSPASVRFIADATRPACPRVSCTDTVPAAPKTAAAKLR